MKTEISKKGLLILCFSSLIFTGPVYADSTVEIEVHLKSFSVRSQKNTLPAGRIRFVAKNIDTEEHELVVRKIEGAVYKEIGEIEAIAPGTGKVMTLDLLPGKYELSCLIIEKEDGETVDHYKSGMHMAFVVR